MFTYSNLGIHVPINQCECMYDLIYGNVMTCSSYMTTTAQVFFFFFILFLFFFNTATGNKKQANKANKMILFQNSLAEDVANPEPFNCC